MTNSKPTTADNHCDHEPTRGNLGQGWLCAHCGTPVEIVPREVMGVTDEMVEIAIGGWNARLDELRGGGYMITHGNTRDRHQMKAALQAALARFDAVMGNDDNNKGTT